MARVLVVAAAVVFAFALAAVLLPMLAVSPRDAAGPSASPAAVRPGETLAVGGVEYRTTALEFKKEVQWGRTSGSIERAAGLWAIVRVDVTNTTGQFQRIPWLRVTIRGVEGTHRLNDSLSRLLSRASGYGSIDDMIAPGAQITTLLVFDVPTTRELVLEIQGGVLELN